MSPEEIERLRELLAKATPGPWFHNPPAKEQVIANGEHFVICHAPSLLLQRTAPANIALIVAAVNALPSLLSDLDRLAADVARLEEAWNALQALVNLGKGDYAAGLEMALAESRLRCVTA